jgi:hypothetical protein
MTGAPQLYNPEDDHAKLQRNAALTHLEKNKCVSSFTQDEDSQAISSTRSHFKSIDLTLGTSRVKKASSRLR